MFGSIWLPSIVKVLPVIHSHHLSLTSNILLDNASPLQVLSWTDKLILCFTYHFGTMYRQPSLRLRPEVRGTFDEERCRMRLQDIGAEIVPRFLYADGMQEIYAILLGEYGRSQIADVISLLHELLEDDSIEGHVWRSWRYGWRHRNVCEPP